MKKLPFAALTLSLLFFLDLSAQSNLQAGASAVLSKTSGIGGEITGNFQVRRNLSIGIGIRPMKFEEHRSVYMPVYGTLKYYYPLSRSRLFASIDPGYGIYPSEDISDGVFEFRRKGAIYLSGGIGIMGNSKLSPYASVHFTKFGFTEQYGVYSQYRPISTFTFTAGVVINRPSSSSSITRVADKPARLPVSHTQEYYLRKSKRQKTTAWILLGSGVTLITSGIIIAANQEEAGIEAAIPLVFISGPGIVTSLVSIPFFISSSHNKKRAGALSPAVGLQQGPGKRFPAMGVRLEF
jgi:hypothetical protein